MSWGTITSRAESSMALASMALASRHDGLSTLVEAAFSTFNASLFFFHHSSEVLGFKVVVYNIILGDRQDFSNLMLYIWINMCFFNDFWAKLELFLFSQIFPVDLNQQIWNVLVHYLNVWYQVHILELLHTFQWILRLFYKYETEGLDSCS